MSKHPQAPIEVWTDERCYVTELINDPDYPAQSLARCRVEPGVTTQLHSLSVLEWYVIESGRGRMQVGSGPAVDVAPGDTVRIPAGSEQRITNTGLEDLTFVCVCVPRFTPECYTSHE